AARAESMAATGERRAARASGRRQVRFAWFGLAAAEAGTRIATERADRAKRNREAVGALYDSGRVSRLDLVRAAVDEAVARAARDAAREGPAPAARTLGSILGLPPSPPVVTAGDLPVASEEGSLEELTARALGSPEVGVEQERLAAAEARLGLA